MLPPGKGHSGQSHLFLVDACDTVKTSNFSMMKLWHPQGHKLQRANVSVVNTDELAVAVRACAAWVHILKLPFSSCSIYKIHSCEIQLLWSEYLPVYTHSFSTRGAKLKSLAWDFETNVLLRMCLSYPQSPKPISKSSDDWGSFSSFLIGSKGKKRVGIAPVGVWELEFWSSLFVSLNFIKLL